MIKNSIIGFFLLNVFYGYSQDTDFQEQIDDYKILSNDTDSVNFPDYFKQQDKVDSISKNYGNWYRRALAIEDYLIKDCSVEIEIDSLSRIVRFQNGQKQILTPNYTFDEAGYTYEKEFKDLDLLLFRVQWFEGNNYFLFNTKTGEKTYTIGRVYFNPDNTLLISINDDIDPGYSENGFQLFKIEKNGSLKEIWKFSPSWAPENIKWIDSSNLIVSGYYYSEQEDWKYKRIYKKIMINER